jgi:hypothetical protein
MFGETLFAKFNRVENVDDVFDVADSYSVGDSAYNIQIKTGNTFVDLVINTPIRMFLFIASPLPWQWRGLNDLIAFVFSALFYIYCYATARKALKQNLEDKTLIIGLLTICIASMLIFSWGVSNAGTALRHRDKFITDYLLLLIVSKNELYKIQNKNT